MEKQHTFDETQF